MKKQNNLGQFTKEMSILITKELQNLAHEAEVRVKPILRDKLEETHRLNVYASRTPAINGKYHHTGILASSIKGVIDGNTVKAVVEPKKFPNRIRSNNGAKLTTEVYEILKNGSKARAKHDVYPYEGKQKKEQNKDKVGPMKWSTYIQQKPHDFEQRTLDDMEQYISQDLIPALTKKNGYLYEQLVKKYTDKIAKKNKMV